MVPVVADKPFLLPPDSQTAHFHFILAAPFL
jgi:hypothetical protein